MLAPKHEMTDFIDYIQANGSWPRSFKRRVVGLSVLVALAGIWCTYVVLWSPF